MTTINNEITKEVYEFFKVVQYLIDKHIMNADMYACRDNIQVIKVESESDIRINMDKRLDWSQWDWIAPKGVQPSVLYINMSITYKLYISYSMYYSNINILNQSTLKQYLKQNASYIGIVRGKKIGGKTVRVWAFDTTKLADFRFKTTPLKGKVDDVQEKNTTQDRDFKQKTAYDSGKALFYDKIKKCIQKKTHVFQKAPQNTMFE